MVPIVRKMDAIHTPSLHEDVTICEISNEITCSCIPGSTTSVLSNWLPKACDAFHRKYNTYAVTSVHYEAA